MKSFSNYIVDIKNLKNNISKFKRLLKDDVKLCAVVKADSYGVGVNTVCDAVADYVDYFAVSNVIEAKQIREINIKTNILILGAVPLEEIEYCCDNNIDISVFSIDYLKAIASIINNKQLRIHLKINTGLNRYGIKRKNDLKKALDIMANYSNIKLIGVFTHFATKGNDLEFIKIQKSIFDDFCQLLPNGIIKHCANSFASLYSSAFQMNMIRVGANMYGDIREEKISLKNVVSIKSQIVAINTVKKGQSVGYDRTYLAHNNCKIAVVPLGYADGIPRKASNKMYVLVGGKKAKIVGYVCMDAFMIDITNINAFVGTEVVILGKSENEEIRLSDWAKVLGTSSYEILLNFRYKRMNYITT